MTDHEQAIALTMAIRPEILRRMMAMADKPACTCGPVPEPRQPPPVDFDAVKAAAEAEIGRPDPRRDE